MQTRQLHSLLGNEAREKIIKHIHHAAITDELERPVPLDGSDTRLFYVAGDDPRKRSSQISRQFVGG